MNHRRMNPPHELIAWPLGSATSRYRAGWWIVTNDQTGERRAEAYVMPRTDDWADIYSAVTWWDAMAKAIALADELPDCAYVGGEYAFHG